MIILWLFEIRTPSLHVTFVSYIYRYIACTTHTIYTIRKLGNLSSGRIEHSPRQRLCVICYHCCVPCDLLPQSLEDKYTIPLYPTSIVVIRGPPEIFMCSRICRKTADDIHLIQIQPIRVRAYSCMLTNITRFFATPCMYLFALSTLAADRLVVVTAVELKYNWNKTETDTQLKISEGFLAWRTGGVELSAKKRPTQSEKQLCARISYLFFVFFPSFVQNRFLAVCFLIGPTLQVQW